MAGFLATAARHRRGTFLWRVRYELQLASGWLMLAPLLVALVLLAGTQVLAAIFTGPTPPGEWSLQQTAVVIWLFPVATPLASALALTASMAREGRWRIIDLIRSRRTLWRFAALRGMLALGAVLLSGMAVALAINVFYVAIPLDRVVTLFAVNLLVLAAAAQMERTVILSMHIASDIGAACPSVAVLHQGRVIYSGSTGGSRPRRTAVSGKQPCRLRRRRRNGLCPASRRRAKERCCALWRLLAGTWAETSRDGKR